MQKLTGALSALTKLLNRRRALTAVFAACVALLAAWLQYDARLAAAQSPSLAFMADKGEPLLHAVRSSALAWSMPAPSVLSALLVYHAGPGAYAAVFIGLKAATLFLVFALAAGAGVPLAGLAALLAALPFAGGNFEQLLYAFSLLAFLNLAAARAAGGAAANAAAGFGFGLTLLVRPALFPLAPLLLLPWLAGKRNARPLRALAFAAAACAALAPWTLVNYQLDKKLVVFERGRADCNIISTVLRSDSTVEGDCRALAGLAPGESALRWAAARVLPAPWPYVFDGAKRFFRLFLAHPLLWLLALAGLALGQTYSGRLSGACALGLGLFYSAFSFEPRYAEPLAYLLALPGAAWLCGLPGLKPAATEPYAAPGLAVSGAGLGAGLVLAALLLSHAFSAKNIYSAVTAALSRHPGDLWLLEKRADLLLWNDNTEAGLAALGAAAEVSALGFPLAPRGEQGGRSGEALARAALEDLDAGRSSEAAYGLGALAGFVSENHIKVRGPGGARAERLLAELRGAGNIPWHFVSQALRFWPSERRGVLLRRLSAAAPWFAVPHGVLPLSVPAEYELDGEDLARELIAKDCAGAAASGDFPLEYAYGRYRASAAPWTALWLALSGRDIRFSQSERSALLAAAAAPEKSAAAPPGGQPALGILAVCRNGGAAPAGWAALRRPALFELAARLAGEAKDAAALKTLGAYLDAHPRELGGYAHNLALSLQQAGAYPAAIERFDKLLAGKPGDPKLLNDRGMCRLLAGNRAAAGADFRAALAASPGFAEAERNLAYLARL
ncbi:MAG: hypothetical protein A2X32_02975 [Elusimicrobia bacterium GWC2_64_44]|nr:MAG: hypothetical protein A2X32_02975 [Elusimicrobia bacterium GWC2_64_44]